MTQPLRETHYIVTKFLFPKSGPVNSASNFEQCIIWHMVEGNTMNMLVFLVRALKHCRVQLSLGSLITRILEHYVIDFKEEEAQEVYVHVEKLAEKIKKGAASVEDVEAKLWQVITRY
ncbi:uncharacterized protein [Euphorbia lathyris]|uniref:uncharacterized protein n=1 Tax=Euphorbia lathyris TaxID=212925 RepID=UPI003313242F